MHRMNRIGITALLVVNLLFNSGCTSLDSAAPWHRIQLESEFTAKDLTDTYQWQDYLAQEDRVFRELSEKLAAEDTTNGLRFASSSQFNPLLQTPNWNRTFILVPQKIRAGILMLHGLTDSPYSVRSLALALQAQGFLVIAPRVPGHGTIPSALLDAEWEDWAALTRLAAKEVKRQLGDNPNFYMLGYSNGGALTLNYSLDAITDTSLPMPKKIVLLSPMIGVSKYASLTKPVDLLGKIPGLSSTRWLSKIPEYNPFKYNSFPINAGWQSHRFSTYLQEKIATADKHHRLQKLPPVLTFQSLRDTTVNTDAIEKYLYRLLPANNSELVVFDLNRNENFIPLMKPEALRSLHDIFGVGPRPYDFVKIANHNSSTMEVSEWRQASGETTMQERPLGLEFPPGVFSLSHVSVPFPPDDPTFGIEPNMDEFFGVRLGKVQLRGESGTVVIKAAAGMRLYSNPFYPYMQERIFDWLEVPTP